MEKLTALKAFRRVVELESFSKAARDLRLSNAAVSKNVRELEEELGAALLQRTTRRLHLTPVGEAYFERTVALLDGLAEADREAKESSAAPHGLLRVSCPMSLGLTKIMPAISEFLVQHPALRIDLEMNDRVVDLVHEGFDLGIRGGSALADTSLIARRLTDIDRVIVAAPSYLARAGVPKSPADLRAPAHACLIYSLAAQPGRWTFASSKKSGLTTIAVDGPLRVSSSLALVQAATHGLGIAAVPRFTARDEIESGALVTLLDKYPLEPQVLYAIYPKHRESSRRLRLLVDHLISALR